MPDIRSCHREKLLQKGESQGDGATLTARPASFKLASVSVPKGRQFKPDF